MTSSVNRINYSINHCWFIRIRNLYEHFLWDSLCFSILMKSNTSTIWNDVNQIRFNRIWKKKHTIHNIPSHSKWIFYAHFLFVLVNWKNIVTNVHSCVVLFLLHRRYCDCNPWLFSNSTIIRLIGSIEFQVSYHIRRTYLLKHINYYTPIHHR